MLNLCGIMVAILKMATGRNFAMSGINSGHHNLPTYEMALKLDNVEFVRYCGGHFGSLPNRSQTTGLKNRLKATIEIEQC
jgi:hypothetical protein